MIRITVVYEYEPNIGDYEGAKTEQDCLAIDQEQYENGNLTLGEYEDPTSVTWEVIDPFSQ